MNNQENKDSSAGFFSNNTVQKVNTNTSAQDTQSGMFGGGNAASPIKVVSQEKAEYNASEDSENQKSDAIKDVQSGKFGGNTQETNQPVVPLIKPSINPPQSNQPSVPYMKQSINPPPQSNQINFSKVISQELKVPVDMNPGYIKRAKETEASTYTKASISDLDQKMAQIAQLSEMGNTKNPSDSKHVSNTNTSVNNYINNVTQIQTDYLQNIRSNYERTPQWRTDAG